MKWATSIARPERKQSSIKDLLADCCQKLKQDLRDTPPDLALAFVSPDFSEQYTQVPEILAQELGAQVLIGCSAGGLIGGRQEIEAEPAIALTAAVLPGVEIKPFHLEDKSLPDLDDPPDKWEQLVGTQAQSRPEFLLLPDPFSIRVDALVQGLDFAFPKSVKLGGLASGATQPDDNVLFLNQEVYQHGAVGVALSGNVIVDSVVAQGCRPIGHPMRVSRCKSNFLYELDGQPAIKHLHDALVSLGSHDQELAKHSLFLGVVMDEFKTEHKPGDFLIRNILGLEPNSGALIVGEELRNERTVQFHLRDASTSAEDLRFMLKRYCESNKQDQAAGALLFSCLGRGKYLYGQSNYDSDCLREYLGDIPVGGFFCNGEIGPVGGTTFLHGYTSSFGIFRAKGS